MSSAKTRKAAVGAAAAISRVANVPAVLKDDDDVESLLEIPEETNRQQLRDLATLIDKSGFPIEGVYEDAATHLDHVRVAKRKLQRAFADSPPETQEQQQQQPVTKKSSRIVIISNDDNGEDDDSIPEVVGLGADRTYVIDTSAYSDRLRALFKSIGEKVATLDAQRTALKTSQGDVDSGRTRTVPSPLSLQIAEIQKKIHSRLDDAMEWMNALEKMQALEANIQRDSAELSRALNELRKKCD